MPSGLLLKPPAKIARRPPSVFAAPAMPRHCRLNQRGRLSRFHDLICVAGDAHLTPRLQHLPIGSYQKRAALHSHVLPPVHRLLHPRPIPIRHRVLLVRRKRESQPVFGREPLNRTSSCPPPASHTDPPPRAPRPTQAGKSARIWPRTAQSASSCPATRR